MKTRRERKNKIFTSRKLILYSVFSAAAVALSAVESMIPVPVPVPGVRLGLANVVTLVILLNERTPVPAIAVTIVRCTLSALLLGAFSSLLFSLAGGVISCLIMWLLLHFNFTWSPVGISVFGALTHNVAQLATAALIARNTAVFSYLSPLLIAGAATGFATGFISLKLKRIVYFKS